jgi:hypothetical protein
MGTLKNKMCFITQGAMASTTKSSSLSQDICIPCQYEKHLPMNQSPEAGHDNSFLT